MGEMGEMVDMGYELLMGQWNGNVDGIRGKRGVGKMRFTSGICSYGVWDGFMSMIC